MACCASATLTMLPQFAAAQAPYPAKPIRFIVGFGPGATNDFIARLLGQKLTEQLGQSVLVEFFRGLLAPAGTNPATEARLLMR